MRRYEPVVSLLVVDLLLLGAVLAGWLDGRGIIVFLWAECAIAWGYTMLRVLLCSGESEGVIFAAGGSVVFLVIWAIIGGLLADVLGLVPQQGPQGNLVKEVLALLGTIPHAGLALAALAIAHGVTFGLNCARNDAFLSDAILETVRKRPHELARGLMFVGVMTMICIWLLIILHAPERLSAFIVLLKIGFDIASYRA